MRTAVVILFLGVVVGAYLFYVRGRGVQPATSAPQTIERQGVARTYAWTQKAEMPTPIAEARRPLWHGDWRYRSKHNNGTDLIFGLALW